MAFSWTAQPARRLLVPIIGQIVLLLAIGGTVSYQVRMVEHKINDMADLKDPSPFTANLMGILNSINFNLASFIQNRDPLLKEAVETHAREFETTVAEFHRDNPRLFPDEAHRAMIAAYQSYRVVSTEVMRISIEQSKRWESLLLNDDDMMFWLEHRLRPIVRNNQPDAAARLNMILNLESQLRSIPKDLAEYVMARTANSPKQGEENNQKFMELLQEYRGIAKAVTERANLDTLNHLWNDNVILAQDIIQLEKTKRDAFARMMKGHQQLQSTIRDVLPAVRPEIIQEKKRAIFHSITMILIMAGVLVLGGIGSLIAGGLWSYRRLRAAAPAAEPAQTPAPADKTAPVSPDRLFRQAMIGIGLDGKIVRWDNGAEQLYGYRAKEIEGQSMKILFSSEDEIQRVSQRLKDNKQAAFDTTHLRKDGSSVPVHVVFDRVTDPTGKLASLSLQTYERAA